MRTRADAALASRDITGARLFLRKLAEAGDAVAAAELALTFDDAFLARIGIVGRRGDPQGRDAWSQKAQDLGGAVGAPK
jgi:hypothetical protein